MKAVLVLALSCALAASAAAKDIHMAADGSGDYKKLAKALKAAAPGDVLVIKKASGMVGAILKADKDVIFVEGTVAGSPAEAAGLKKGERVLAVDGIEMAGRSISEVVMRIRGPVGMAVTLKVSGESGEREVSIMRGGIRHEIKDDLSKMAIARSEEDFDTAADYAQKLAEGGAVEAQSLLAFFYHNGTGVKKDPKKAFFWAARGAESGDAPSQRLIAFFYANGLGTPKDLVQSVYWNRKAADKNDPYAMVNLAAAYENGAGVPADPGAALELYRRALAQGALTAASAADTQSRVARLEKTVGASARPAAAPVAVAVAPAAVKAPAAPASVRSDIDELPASRPVRPEAVAVVIGIERYRENLPKADFAAADARLAAEYFKRVLGVSEENLAVLIDERASKSDFAKYFEQWLPNHIDKGSDVFVYFSGHGAPDPAKGDAYLVPYDGDPTYIKQTGYSVKRLYALLGKLPAKSVTVAMDSCFSGAGGRSVLAKGARPLVTIKTDAPPSRVTVIAASAGDQISNSWPEKGHGLFTYYFLKGLKEKGGDIRAAYDYLKPEVTRAARRSFNSDQEPQWRGGQ